MYIRAYSLMDLILPACN